jgi:DNA-binding MarR family transcriptional regulator
MASFELLNAVNLKNVRTTGEVAEELGVSVADAERQLGEAQRAGLIIEEEDLSVNVPADFNRQYWRLTEDGHKELYRLEDEHGA